MMVVPPTTIITAKKAKTKKNDAIAIPAHCKRNNLLCRFLSA